MKIAVVFFNGEEECACTLPEIDGIEWEVWHSLTFRRGGFSQELDLEHRRIKFNTDAFAWFMDSGAANPKADDFFASIGQSADAVIAANYPFKVTDAARLAGALKNPAGDVMTSFDPALVTRAVVEGGTHLLIESDFVIFTGEALPYFTDYLGSSIRDLGHVQLNCAPDEVCNVPGLAFSRYAGVEDNPDYAVWPCQPVPKAAFWYNAYLYRMGRTLEGSAALDDRSLHRWMVLDWLQDFAPFFYPRSKIVTYDRCLEDAECPETLYVLNLRFRGELLFERLALNKYEPLVSQLELKVTGAMTDDPQEQEAWGLEPDVLLERLKEEARGRGFTGAKLRQVRTAIKTLFEQNPDAGNIALMRRARELA